METRPNLSEIGNPESHLIFLSQHQRRSKSCSLEVDSENIYRMFVQSLSMKSMKSQRQNGVHNF